jgi:hypothetical protein
MGVDHLKDLALELTARAPSTQGGDVSPYVEGKLFIHNRKEPFTERGPRRLVCCQAASTVLIHTWCPLWVGAIADAIYTHCTQRNAWRE